MAFEALNHAGHIKRDLIVILNDNEMSISPNVGALSSSLSRIISGQAYNRFRDKVNAVLEGIPGHRRVGVRALPASRKAFLRVFLCRA